MMFPVDDWQFWVVSALAACAMVFIVRRVVPPEWLPWKSKPKGRGATLTLDGRPVARSAKRGRDRTRN